jgi:Ca2+/Na+ antiporter
MTLLIMSLKQLLTIVTAATVICWLSWLLVLMEVDPTSSGWLGLSIFYISLFFSLLGLFFLIVLVFRKFSNKSDLEYQIVGASFRQSFFFALVVIGALFLQSKHFLTWWNIIILVLAIGALEYFFLSYRKSVPAKKPDSSNPPEGYIPPDF